MEGLVKSFLCPSNSCFFPLQIPLRTPLQKQLRILESRSPLRVSPPVQWFWSPGHFYVQKVLIFCFVFFVQYLMTWYCENQDDVLGLTAVWILPWLMNIPSPEFIWTQNPLKCVGNTELVFTFCTMVSYFSFFFQALAMRNTQYLITFLTPVKVKNRNGLEVHYRENSSSTLAPGKNCTMTQTACCRCFKGSFKLFIEYQWM